ncbi:MAG: FmdB family zinc ribbon protein [Rudaea sp.]
MPIYEFQCSTCDNRFECLQKLSDPDPDRCPECGKPTVKRCVTAPVFRLAGSGWYETDFKKEGDRKHNLAGKDEAPKVDTSKADAPKLDAAKPTVEPKSGDKPAAKPAPDAKPTAAKPAAAKPD